MTLTFDRHLGSKQTLTTIKFEKTEHDKHAGESRAKVLFKDIPVGYLRKRHGFVEHYWEFVGFHPLASMCFGFPRQPTLARAKDALKREARAHGVYWK